MGCRTYLLQLCLLASLVTGPTAAQYDNFTISDTLLPYYTLPSSQPSTCPSSTEILLYLDLYVGFSCIAFLALGTKSVRSILSHNRLLSCHFTSDHPRLLRCISILGSLLIHTAASVMTADVLAASNAASAVSPPLGRMFLFWVSRPLATALIAWLSIADRKAYHDSAREVAIVDSIYSLINIYLFGSVAYITNVRPSEVPAPARLARAGSALWLLACVLSIGVLVWYVVVYSRSHNSSSYSTDGEGKKGPKFMQLLPCIWFLLDSLRFGGCWLLWAGLLYSDEAAFCPSQRALTDVTVIWLFVPVADFLWRGFATCREDKQGAEAEIQNLMDM